MKLADKLELTFEDRRNLAKALTNHLAWINSMKFDSYKAKGVSHDAAILGAKLEKWLATVDDDISEFEDDE